jgi:multiple sugar transport system substrate-binding protein
MRLRRLQSAALGLSALALVAGCSSSSSTGTTSSAGASSSAPAPASSVSAASSSAPATGAKVNLTFWSWVPNIDKIVAVWNKAHPDIHVDVSKNAQGDAEVTKLLTADKAGNPPDVAQAEYQALPVLVTNHVAADISKSVNPLKGDFSAGLWNAVTLGTNAVYGIPQDSGPMMLYYRVDLFKQFGLTVPTTWDDFAKDAQTLRQKDPKRYLTTFSSGDGGWFSGLSGQAGGKWWSLDGSKWTVGIDDAATTKVANYWGDLVNKGIIDGEKMFTPQWNKELDDGTLLTWPSAVWGPGVLSSVAPHTKGKWAVAPLPQWSAGDNVSGFWGGSSTAVMTKSKHQAEAIQFATWLNTDPAALQLLVVDGAVYPAATVGQSVPALKKAPDFFSNQPDFWATASKIGATATGFTWGPNVNVAYGKYNDTFAAAILKKGSFSDALKQVQDATVADLKKSGFTVAG